MPYGLSQAATLTAARGPAARPALVPAPFQVVERLEENAETVTLGVQPADGEPLPFRPGQFAMLYAFGVGEIAMSVSGLPDPTDGGLQHHTVRAVGAVSRALCATGPGSVVGVRGPFGNDWTLGATGAERTPLGTEPGADLLVVAGGLGLAPVRPVIEAALAEPEHYGQLAVLFGARDPGGLIYHEELLRWGTGAEVRVTVDEAGEEWTGRTGLVTTLLDTVRLRPDATTAFVCGPEPMMRGTASALLERGMDAGRIRVSLERNMRCGTGWCGHCQLGEVLICRDGPVFDWHEAAGLLAVRER
ncbi:FAD/NAD(P)-binding protein [Phaeacidiphilus oryzae]|uniref:FAD/NAD(P)-binding protein n=1 Tax=Phaeacidiphilus oryzae TaxID=348818 RepID=UPI0009FBBC42|nr:FAD/NAD(P)-binding protein [Phaeacidiphilus oryzae]